MTMTSVPSSLRSSQSKVTRPVRSSRGSLAAISLFQVDRVVDEHRVDEPDAVESVEGDDIQIPRNLRHESVRENDQ